MASCQYICIDKLPPHGRTTEVATRRICALPRYWIHELSQSLSAFVSHIALLMQLPLMRDNRESRLAIFFTFAQQRDLGTYVLR